MIAVECVYMNGCLLKHLMGKNAIRSRDMSNQSVCNNTHHIVPRGTCMIQKPCLKCFGVQPPLLVLVCTSPATARPVFKHVHKFFLKHWCRF